MKSFNNLKKKTADKAKNMDVVLFKQNSQMKEKTKIQPEINSWLFSCQPVTYIKQLLTQRLLLLLEVLMLSLLQRLCFH